MALIHPQTAFCQESVAATAGKGMRNLLQPPWTVSKARRRGDIFLAAFPTAQPQNIVQDWQLLGPGEFPVGNCSLSAAIPPASKRDTFFQRAQRAGARHQLPKSGKAAVLKHPWIESLSPWRSRDMPNQKKGRGSIHPWGCSHRAALSLQVEATCPLSTL